MNKRFTLWASDWTDNYDTEKFSIGRACFLSSAPNTHQLAISPEVLKQCASSILGCFLVADVDTDFFGNKDFTTHVPQEKIIGYAPVEQEIEFEQDEDGIVRAYATFVISKMYAGEEIGIFSDTGNLQNVSVEMMVTTEDEESNVVTEFDIFGLTVLGKQVNGSCPSACMSVTRFSVEEAIEAFHNKEVIKMQEENMNAVENLAVEEAECSEEECKCAEEETEMSCDCDSSEEDMECKKCAEDEVECAESEEECECAENEVECAEDTEVECAEDEVECADTEIECAGEEVPEDLSATVAQLNQQIADMAAQIENNNNIIMEQERELAELRAFRDATQAAQLASDVEEVLSEVSSAFSEEQLAEYRSEAIEGGNVNFDAWSNKVKAAAFSATKDTKKEQIHETLWGGFLRMSAPVNISSVRSNSIWD